MQESYRSLSSREEQEGKREHVSKGKILRGRRSQGDRFVDGLKRNSLQKKKRTYFIVRMKGGHNMSSLHKRTSRREVEGLIGQFSCKNETAFPWGAPFC